MGAEFKPTKSQRDQAEIAAGGGMRHEELAEAFGISVPTLRKHFAKELSIGAHRRRVNVLESIYRAGCKGNAAAAKAYLASVPEAAAPDGEPHRSAPEASKPLEPLGKKAQANEAAKTAQVGTGWADILPTGTGSRIQ